MGSLVRQRIPTSDRRPLEGSFAVCFVSPLRKGVPCGREGQVTILRMAGLVILAAACGGLSQALAVQWGDEVLRKSREWYASSDARAAADTVLLHQTPSGGWPKNTDLLIPPQFPEDLGRPTIDNGATTTPMQFLALVIDGTGDTRYRQAFERGMDYLLAAQYPNGGWPQYFPLREGYYSRITFNDGAMVNVLSLLRDAGRGESPYGFLDQSRRDRAVAAVGKGIDLILRSQVRQSGELTAWCAQHDERTLEPAWARSYEPPSLSGGESVGIVRFLMSVRKQTPQIAASIEGAVRWLRKVAISGFRVQSVPGPDGRDDRILVQDPDAPLLWARFYELGSNRPLYLDRDSVYRYDYSEIGVERRSGYRYHGTWAAELLERDYSRWRARRRLQ